MIQSQSMCLSCMKYNKMEFHYPVKNLVVTSKRKDKYKVQFWSTNTSDFQLAT